MSDPPGAPIDSSGGGHSVPLGAPTRYVKSKLIVDLQNARFALFFLLVALIYHSTEFKHINKSLGPYLKGEKFCLAVGVVSASANRAQRGIIRQGWGISPGICRLKFFIATNQDWNIVEEIQSEGEEFKDVVLVQAAESYYNITYQTLDIFRTMTVDPLVTHVMKADDDSYVRMELISKFLQENEKNLRDKELFAGYLEPISGPIRDVNSKWYMGQSDWPYDYYPTWAHGAGYMLSANLARSIGNGAAALSMQGKILHLEDVSTGIWIDYLTRTLKKQVQMIHDTRFNFFPACLDTDFISHYASPGLQACLAGKKTCEQCKEAY